jgi:hypothetical protein
MKPLTLFALLAFAAVPLAAQASSDNSRKHADLRNPGEWQFTVTRRIEVPGTAMSIPPKTIKKKVCLSKQAIEQPLSEKLKALSGPAQKKGETCKPTKKKLVGNTVTFAMNCSGKQGHVHIFGKLVYDSKETSHSHVRLNTKSHGMPVEIKLNTRAKRVGECKAPPGGK